MPEEVPLHLEVLREVGDALIYGKKETSIVIEDLAVHGRFVGVDSKSSGLGGCLAVIAVGHASGFLDLLEKTFWSEGQCSICQSAGEIDAYEVGERTLSSEVETLGFQV